MLSGATVCPDLTVATKGTPLFLSFYEKSFVDYWSMEVCDFSWISLRG